MLSKGSFTLDNSKNGKKSESMEYPLECLRLEFEKWVIYALVNGDSFEFYHHPFIEDMDAPHATSN